MSKVRGAGNRSTELRLVRLFRSHSIVGWRRHVKITSLRVRPDFVFRAARVAVFVDGCFWHGCPEHGTWPKENADWWRGKIEANKRRDRDTDARLTAAGWTVIRVWEHEDLTQAADHIVETVRRAITQGEGAR